MRHSLSNSFLNNQLSLDLTPHGVRWPQLFSDTHLRKGVWWSPSSLRMCQKEKISCIQYNSLKLPNGFLLLHQMIPHLLLLIGIGLGYSVGASSLYIAANWLALPPCRGLLQGTGSSLLGKGGICQAMKVAVGIHQASFPTAKWIHFGCNWCSGEIRLSLHAPFTPQLAYWAHPRLASIAKSFLHPLNLTSSWGNFTDWNSGANNEERLTGYHNHAVKTRVCSLSM